MPENPEDPGPRASGGEFGRPGGGPGGGVADPEDPENHLEAVVDTVALVAHPEDTLNMDQDPVTQLQLQILELQL